MLNKHRRLYLVIIVFLVSTSPLYGMLALKEKKKQSAAYAALRERKLKDRYLLDKRDPEIFEFVITFGQQVSSLVSSSLGTAVGLGAANVVHKLITGETLTDRLRNMGKNETKEDKRINEVCKYKADHDHLDREDLDYMDDEDFPKNYDGTFSYSIEKDKHSEKGYKLIPNPNTIRWMDIQTTLHIPQQNTVTSKPSDRSELPQSTYIDEERIWLESFAQKICPSGGYTIENIPQQLDEDIVDVAFPSPMMPNNNNPKKPKDDKDSYYEDLLKQKGSEIANNLAQEAASEGFMEAGKRIKEYYSGEERKKEEDLMTIHKIPNYNSGKRLENWNKAHGIKTTSSKTPVKQETPKISPTTIKSEPTQTNASRWDYDDLSSSSPHDSGSYLSSLNDDEVADFFDGYPEFYDAYKSSK